MITATEFINDLKTKVFCRIGASKIQGVGVIAVRPIPKGINPMQEDRPCVFETCTRAAIESAQLPKSIMQLVVDLCPENDGVFDIPNHILNSCGVAWFLNHSKTPNMEERDGDFFTLREIAEGEELTVNYGTYGELNL